jgi:hypothetical protein
LLLTFFGLALPPNFLEAAPVLVRQENGNLTYRIEQAPFLPEKSKKELASGISNKIVLMAKLIEIPARTVIEQIVSLDAKYNLWDENFRLQFSDGRQQTMKTQAELEEKIQNPGPFVLVRMTELRGDATYRVQVIQTVNPLDTARLDAVKNWMLAQKAPAQAAGSPKDQTSRVGAQDSAFSELFFSLWRRARAGELLVGEVRQELQSAAFTAAQLRPESERRKR